MRSAPVDARSPLELPGLQDLKSFGALMWSQVEDFFAEGATRRMIKARWRNGMKFLITGKQAVLNRHNKPCEVKVGIWVDRSRYTGARCRALRAERGCGRPPRNEVAA
jgi:hypothetical protein